VRLFPETFSFHADRHDPAELFLQLEDLARKPELLSPRANRRDVEQLVARLVTAAPRYLEALLDRLAAEARLDEAALLRVHQDVALVAATLSRFVGETGQDERPGRPGRRLAALQLRRLSWRALHALARGRVDPAYWAAYVTGRVDPVDPADDLSEAGFFYTLEGDDPEAVNRCLVRLSERAFLRWLEEVCLDETVDVFEAEGSPFADRETEVLRAVAAFEGAPIVRGRDLSPYLRRPRNKDCLRVLSRLEGWFLRQYDIHHAAVVIHHAACLARGEDDSEQVLSRHRTRNYLLALGALASPFLGAVFAYDRAPLLFDALCAGELLLAYAAVLWFFIYRFLWKRDLAFFHASVPRIAAGIIVGYLPIFFIDEVWDLAQRSWLALSSVVLLLAFTTLLYLYIEVQRRLPDPAEAFARARQIFLLGTLQAFGIGLIITGLVGRFMVVRNWTPEDAADPSVEALRGTLSPFLGELPKIMGLEPLYAFPTAVFTMTFLSYFIGTFLQLMWEDLPITEPL